MQRREKSKVTCPILDHRSDHSALMHFAVNTFTSHCPIPLSIQAWRPFGQIAVSCGDGEAHRKVLSCTWSLHSFLQIHFILALKITENHPHFEWSSTAGAPPLFHVSAAFHMLQVIPPEPCNILSAPVTTCRTFNTSFYQLRVISAKFSDSTPPNSENCLNVRWWILSFGVGLVISRS